jgi:glutaredoxin 3
MQNVTIYGTRACSYCRRAEEFLRQKGVTGIDKVLIDTRPDALEAMIARTGRRSVPQIFIGAAHIGGYDELRRLEQTGKLDPLLSGESAITNH